MYENVGSKIKTVAKVFCVIIGIASIIAGIAMWVTTGNVAFSVLMIFGPLLAWLSSLVMYGFGELIENVAIVKNSAVSIVKLSKNIVAANNKIYDNIDKRTVDDNSFKDTIEDKIRSKKLDKLLKDGLISLEEYDELTKVK